MKRISIAALLFTASAHALGAAGSDASGLLLLSSLDRPEDRTAIASEQPWLILGHGRTYPAGESGTGEVNRVGLGFDILRPLPLGLEITYNDFTDGRLADGQYTTMELAPRYDRGPLRLFGRIGAGTADRDLERFGATYAAGVEYVIGRVPYTWKVRLEWSRFDRIEFADGDVDHVDSATLNLIVAH